MSDEKEKIDNNGEYALLPTEESDEENTDKKLVTITEYRDHEHATTDFETLLHIVKATMGSGILNLPAAVRNAGVVVGPLGLLFVAIVIVHCEHLLVISSRTWCKVRGKSSMDFADVGEECIMTRYPKKGWLGRLIINICLMLAQLGFCCVYMLFVCRNLQQIFANNTDFAVDTRLWLLILLPFYILISFIKNLDSLAWLSFISNVFMIVGFVCIFIYVFQTLHNPLHLPAMAPVKNLPLFFASSIFTYESIGLILPLENEIRNIKRFPSLLNLGMAFVSVLYISMGFFGYLSCTDNCLGSITLNLGETAYSVTVRSMMSASVFLSYFIQAYVPFVLVESWVFTKTGSEPGMAKRCAIRAAIVFFTAVLAGTVPDLEYIIALFGATTSTTLSITLPAILHTISLAPNLSKFTITKNIAIVVFGIAMNILGVAVLVQKVINLYEKPKFLAGKLKV
ncbi:proton-coupled amino acid transporter 1-like isoform X1 [Dendronephthya gigantea]|uniref:proton-coupled amino acid transporter 1-like isoform X1 n=1 Tax=Dendronephthya gigantea TaxID=151771 RepID=UPI00106A818F|nr:proton-coupled amino acid transporter 1-like isoform X1 [Dendronephthya gigantea]